MFYLYGIGKPRLSLSIAVFIMDSRDILVPTSFPHHRFYRGLSAERPVLSGVEGLFLCTYAEYASVSEEERKKK
jgi:hypothetical protein